MTLELSRAVAGVIRTLMQARGVTAYALSKTTGIPQSSLSRKFREKDAAPFDLDDVQKVAAALGVTAADLIAWAEGSAAPPEG